MQELLNDEIDHNQGLAVSATEFARILGVYKSTVSRAISEKRLKKSLKKEGSRYKILVFEGCVEWYLNKQLEKDRYASSPKDIEKSRARKEHYKSLLTKLDYEVRTGDLISFAEAVQKGQEVCIRARQLLENSRDKDCFKIPLISDDFDARKFLKERDDRFLKLLAEVNEELDKVRDQSALIENSCDDEKAEDADDDF